MLSLRQQHESSWVEVTIVLNYTLFQLLGVNKPFLLKYPCSITSSIFLIIR